MTAPDTQLPSARSAAMVDTPRTARLVTVAIATLAPLLVWLIARVVFGLDVRSPTMNGQNHTISPGLVLLTALVPCLLGWGVVAMLERFTTRARLIWLVLATSALVLSLGGPLSGTGVSAGDRTTLILMHLSVGIVLIPGLARTMRGKPSGHTGATQARSTTTGGL